MKRAADQRLALLALTIETIAQRGLGEFSLRHLAGAAGLSTTAIFQNFSGKAQLLADALELAISQDRAFHETLRDQVTGLLSTHISFADFLARYVLLRAALPQARFVSEILVSLDDFPDCHALVQDWHEARTKFWEDLLAQLDVRSGLARVTADYALMEEFYAYSLLDECTYPLLLAETCRALSDCAFHTGAAGPARSHVSLRLDTQPLSIREAEDSSDAPIKEQLLGQALRIIEEAGLEALNQRRLAKSAGVSSSAIAYYFKDMKNFRNRAIWRALVSGIPTQLNPERSPVEQPGSLGEWLATLETLLEPGDAERSAGFYIGFARLTGQACLLSRHDRTLKPLIAYLRELEGWGTYRVSRNIAGLTDLVGRDHAAAFGMWIKSEALLRRVRLVPPATGMARLEFAARQILPAPALHQD